MSDRETGGGPAKPATGWWTRLAEALGLKPQQANLVKLVAIGLTLGLLFLNAGDLFGVDTGTEPRNATQVVADAGVPRDELSAIEAEAAARLERILASVAGAGAVRVTVTLETGPAVSAVADSRVEKTTTREKAADESTRVTESENTQITHVTTGQGSGGALAVMKKSRAQIAGVLIVAEGARNDVVRARLHEAAWTALGISPNRISVMPAGGR